jgi:myo-inositol-1(or 4)-monophosphatase
VLPSPSDVALAVSLVTESGRLAARMRESGLNAQRKTSVTDLVTDADHAAEELVTRTLATARPADGIVGEEGASAIGSSGRTWVIDPVDGTYNFVSGLGTWCSAVALAIDGQAVLGAVYHPQTDTVWVGGPDVPTTRNGQRVRPLDERRLAETSLAAYLHPTRFTLTDLAEPFIAMVRGAATVRMLGSGSMELAQVASSALGLYAHHSAPEWDWLPGQALVLGAGGTSRLVTVRGYTWHLAGNPRAVADGERALTSVDAR